MSKKGENIYKRKDGRWEARYTKGYSANGNIRYGYCYGRTYREAREKVEKQKTTIANDFKTNQPQMNKRLSVYCHEWLQLSKNKVKESTLVKYTTNIEKHINPYLGGCYVQTINSLMINDFANQLLYEDQLSVKTVRDILSLLSSILKYASKQITILHPIDIVYPKELKTDMRVLTRDEQERFVNYLMYDMDDCKFGVLLSLMTGLRIGEICALRWKDVSIDNMTITVSSTMQRLKNLDDSAVCKTKIVISEPKSNTSSRVIPLTDNAVELCRNKTVYNPNAFVLTGSEKHFIEPRTLQYKFEKYTGDCGLTGVHFHILRHTFATRCVEVGFEIKSLSEILGHASPKITLERYVHSSLELKRDNMNKLSAIGY